MSRGFRKSNERGRPQAILFAEHPRDGGSEYDIHHIRPREFGGDNSFGNLTGAVFAVGTAAVPLGRLGNAGARAAAPDAPGANPAPNFRVYPDGSLRTPDGKFASVGGQPSPGTVNASNYADFLRSNGVDVVGTELEAAGPLGGEEI